MDWLAESVRFFIVGGRVSVFESGCMYGVSTPSVHPPTSGTRAWTYLLSPSFFLRHEFNRLLSTAPYALRPRWTFQSMLIYGKIITHDTFSVAFKHELGRLYWSRKCGPDWVSRICFYCPCTKCKWMEHSSESKEISSCTPHGIQWHHAQLASTRPTMVPLKELPCTEFNEVHCIARVWWTSHRLSWD